MAKAPQEAPTSITITPAVLQEAIKTCGLPRNVVAELSGSVNALFDACAGEVSRREREAKNQPAPAPAQRQDEKGQPV